MYKFSQVMYFSLAANSIDIIVGDLRYDLLKVLENELLNNSTMSRW